MVKVLNDLLKESGFSVVNDGLKGLWNPDGNALQACIQFGKEFSKSTR